MNMEPKHRLSQPGSVLFQKSVEDPDFLIFLDSDPVFAFILLFPYLCHY